MSILTGSADIASTRAYAEVFQNSSEDDYFSQDTSGLTISSLGIGTSLGESTDAKDFDYASSIRRAMAGGVNFIDTAINYRSQRSERVVGRALGEMVYKGEVRRNSILLCSKGGFVRPTDHSSPNKLHERMLSLLFEKGIDQNQHTLDVDIIRQQLLCSLMNLNVSSIDIYYLHNPEIALRRMDRTSFELHLHKTFEMLEDCVVKKRIGVYGAAFWKGLRVNRNHQEYCSVEWMVKIAERVGGANHSFRYIQTPFDLSRDGNLNFKNQSVDDVPHHYIDAIKRLGLNLVVSASIYADRTDYGSKSPEQVQESIARVRRFPQLDVILIGMSTPSHVDENLKSMMTRA